MPIWSACFPADMRRSGRLVSRGRCRRAGSTLADSGVHAVARPRIVKAASWRAGLDRFPQVFGEKFRKGLSHLAASGRFCNRRSLRLLRAGDLSEKVSSILSWNCGRTGVEGRVWRKSLVACRQIRPHGRKRQTVACPYCYFAALRAVRLFGQEFGGAGLAAFFHIPASGDKRPGFDADRRVVGFPGLGLAYPVFLNERMDGVGDASGCVNSFD